MSCSKHEIFFINCSRVLQSCFAQSGVLCPRVNVFWLAFEFAEYCCSQWGKMSESKLCCLEHRRKVNIWYWIYKIYHRADYPMHKSLHNFVAARNTKDSAALGELALVIQRRRTGIFSLSFLPAAVSLRNLLLPGVFGGCILNFFLGLLWTCAYGGLSLSFFFFISVSFRCTVHIACLVSLFWDPWPFWFIGVSFPSSSCQVILK